MKRHTLLAHLHDHGCQLLREGGRHSIYFNSAKKLTSAVPRCPYPGVSRDMIRRLLRDLKAAGLIECLGRGPGAKWRKRVLLSKEGNKEGTNRIV